MKPAAPHCDLTAQRSNHGQWVFGSLDRDRSASRGRTGLLAENSEIRS